MLSVGGGDVNWLWSMRSPSCKEPNNHTCLWPCPCSLEAGSGLSTPHPGPLGARAGHSLQQQAAESAVSAEGVMLPPSSSADLVQRADVPLGVAGLAHTQAVCVTCPAVDMALTVHKGLFRKVHNEGCV